MQLSYQYIKCVCVCESMVFICRTFFLLVWISIKMLKNIFIVVQNCSGISTTISSCFMIFFLLQYLYYISYAGYIEILDVLHSYVILHPSIIAATKIYCVFLVSYRTVMASLLLQIVVNDFFSYSNTSIVLVMLDILKFCIY